MSSFQGVGIEEFHCIQRSGVLISGCWNRGVPLYTEVRCPHFIGVPLYAEVSSFQGVGVPLYVEVSSFQGVGIEEFHYM